MNAQTNKSATVTSIQPDAKLANNAGAAERIRILDAINTADDLLSSSLVEALRMTVKHGPTSKDEVAAHFTRCNNPGVYSSWFNLGNKAAQAVGMTAALQAIDRAETTGKGAAFTRCRDALQAIAKGAKELTGGTAPTSRQVKALVTAAVDQAAEKSVAKKAAAKRGARGPNRATMAAAAGACSTPADLAAFTVMAANAASRMPEPDGMSAQWRKAVKALGDASEALAPFKRSAK